MPSRRIAVFALATLIVAALAAGMALWLTRERGGPPLGEALIGGPFALTAQDGRRVTEKDLLGSWSLLFFGYTYCPDVCPGTLQVMSAALDKLGPDAGKIRPVFVTIDPARDTVEAVRDYVANFHPRFWGLTGTPGEIAAIARAYRVYYARPKGEEGKTGYLMEHPSLIFLMRPDGKYARHFSYGASVDDLAEGLKAAIGG